MTHHTPKPWTARGTFVYATGSTNTYSGAVVGAVAHALETEQTDAEGRVWCCPGTPEANARLIAAAPELLQAALFARELFANRPVNERQSEEQKAINLLADAIATARGM